MPGIESKKAGTAMLVDWSVRQKKQVLILLGLILILTSSFLTYEWTQYASGIVEVADPERLYSRLAKTLTSFLVFLLAIRVGDAGINQADPPKLKRAFIVIFLGDLLFLMDEFNPFFDYLAVLACSGGAGAVDPEQRAGIAGLLAGEAE